MAMLNSQRVISSNFAFRSRHKKKQTSEVFDMFGVGEHVNGSHLQRYQQTQHWLLIYLMI